jgi:sugar lactone lactonase YvrE
MLTAFLHAALPCGGCAGTRTEGSIPGLLAPGAQVERARGGIYITSVPGVQVFDKSGQYLGAMPVPRRPTRVAFAGPHKRTLYIAHAKACIASRL